MPVYPSQVGQLASGLGAEGLVATAALALGDLDAHVEEVGFGDRADGDVAQMGSEVAVDGRANGGGMGLAPAGQRQGEPVLDVGAEQRRARSTLGLHRQRPRDNRRCALVGELLDQRAAGEEVGVLEGAGDDGLLDLVEDLLHALAVGSGVRELGVLAATHAPVTEVEEQSSEMVANTRHCRPRHLPWGSPLPEAMSVSIDSQMYRIFLPPKGRI